MKRFIIAVSAIRQLPTIFLLTFLCVNCAGVEPVSSDPPIPDVDRIDYQHPERYLELGPDMGTVSIIRDVARRLAPGGSPEEKLLAIANWIDNHLEDRENFAYAWVNFDGLIQKRAYGGCASHSLAFGALSRALGIPTVWVKTLDLDFIREFKERRGQVDSWRGHVFLEVFLHGRWMLLDAVQHTLYQDYDPRSRLLPGNGLAYDKGGEPYSLVLSTRWELWQEQTRRFLADLDLSKLDTSRSQVAQPRQLNGGQPAYIVADGPMYEWLTKRFKKIGLDVASSFNTDFERLLPEAKGKKLFVVAVGDRLVLPDAYWPEFTGMNIDQFRKRVQPRRESRLDHTTADGTRVVVLYGRTEEDIAEAIKRFVFGARRSMIQTTELFKKNPK